MYRGVGGTPSVPCQNDEVVQRASQSLLHLAASIARSDKQIYPLSPWHLRIVMHRLRATPLELADSLQLSQNQSHNPMG